ncbi:HdeD family acid-resistance protein [Providencia huaxiensis]|uniref:HdeD family acid-resistance protein n=1 Tax=Providencia rettgeri TaxID=587 RepID=A0AAD2VRQ9_PRORE|nr:HdeD family acid-resistance protein [Providencia sp. PROV032]ELR5072922.1 HdeD family acid-resistance protein [Providencia stuartii]ELR5218032.1 HdeD family acid-resistance protein [Providencia rettgeri]HEC8323497.1 HdeD family acid-resistance protein [Providencia rettgeri]
MLNIDREKLAKLAGEEFKKQRTFLMILSILLLAGGLFCIINPMISGIAVSTVLGVLLIIGGVGAIVSILSTVIYTGWSRLFGFIIGLIYIIVGYSFIKDPLQSLVALAILVAALFIVGGVIRLYVGFQKISSASGWLQIIIGLLDFFIAYLLIGNGPITSITLLTTLIGIEMVFSSFSLFALLSVFKSISKNN